MKIWSIAALCALAACAAPQAETPPASENAAPRIVYSLETIDIAAGARTVVLSSGDEIGAPNWSADGRELIYNSNGRLYTFTLPHAQHLMPPGAGGPPIREIPVEGAAHIVHDHGLSPDGAQIALSAYNIPDPAARVASIHVAPVAGGAARQLTTAGPSYFHDWSPDGARIAFTGRRSEDNYDIWDVDVATGAERRLTDAPGTDDAADYAPDGTIYFNSARTGAMRIWKMDADGANQTQVTFDEAYQDWFPHPSPDGRWLVWLSYPAEVAGLESYQPVRLRIMPLDGSAPPRVLAEFIGGQGSINAPSWAPDSSAFAFVSHQVLEP